jgi:hypothetical protein
LCRRGEGRGLQGGSTHNSDVLDVGRERSLRSIRIEPRFGRGAVLWRLTGNR